MGADMIAAMVAIRKDVKPDWKAGHEAVNAIEWSDDLITSLVDDGTLSDLSDECFDHNGNPILKGIEAWAHGLVDDLRDVLGGRASTLFEIRDLAVWIVGGMSWGDSPWGCDQIWNLESLPGVMKAIGFEMDLSEAAKSVSPDEEAAAIDSITKGVST